MEGSHEIQSYCALKSEFIFAKMWMHTRGKQMKHNKIILQKNNH